MQDLLTLDLAYRVVGLSAGFTNMVRLQLRHLGNGEITTKMTSFILPICVLIECWAWLILDTLTPAIDPLPRKLIMVMDAKSVKLPMSNFI